MAQQFANFLAPAPIVPIRHAMVNYRPPAGADPGGARTRSGGRTDRWTTSGPEQSRNIGTTGDSYTARSPNDRILNGEARAAEGGRNRSLTMISIANRHGLVNEPGPAGRAGRNPLYCASRSPQHIVWNEK